MRIRISAANNRRTDKSVTSRDIKIHCSSLIHRCFSRRIETSLGKQSVDHVTNAGDAPSVRRLRGIVAAECCGNVQEHRVKRDRGKWTLNRTFMTSASERAFTISCDRNMEAATVTERKIMRQLSVITNPSAQPISAFLLKKAPVYEIRIKIFIVVHVTLLQHSSAASHSFAMAIHCRWPTTSD